MKNLALYTAIFGKPRRFNFPDISGFDVDRFCYTDLKVTNVPRVDGVQQLIPAKKGTYVKNDFYEIKKVKFPDLIPIKANRFIKLCIPDEIFDNYEFSVYSDCKHPFTFNLKHMLNSLELDSDFLIRKHRSDRDCAYEEGLYCIKRRKDTEAYIMEQLNFYRGKGLPEHVGLYDAGWILRRHTKALREHMQFWWKQVERFSCRDQIALPYVVWQREMKVTLYKRFTDV